MAEHSKIECDNTVGAGFDVAWKIVQRAAEVPKDG